MESVSQPFGVAETSRQRPQRMGDLAKRAAYVSGPPRLISALAPALAKAKSLTTDAFAGY